MLVNPGFGGQKQFYHKSKKLNLLVLCLKSIKRIYIWRLMEEKSFECKNLVQSGANLIVAGNAIFKVEKIFMKKISEP